MNHTEIPAAVRELRAAELAMKTWEKEIIAFCKTHNVHLELRSMDRHPYFESDEWFADAWMSSQFLRPGNKSYTTIFHLSEAPLEKRGKVFGSAAGTQLVETYYPTRKRYADAVAAATQIPNALRQYVETLGVTCLGAGWQKDKIKIVVAKQRGKITLQTHAIFAPTCYAARCRALLATLEEMC